jgi:hypothetical protein
MGGIVSGALSIGGALLGGDNSSNSADAAAQAQYQSAQAGIDEQHRQFDYIQNLLKPFVSAGTGALAGQQDILGLNGNTAQQSSINNITNSPYFGAMKAQGEDSILQNASATGGLRGGNTQLALSQFSPNLLNQLIQQQYSNLGGLTNNGISAANGTGAFGANSSNQITSLLGQQGAAQAGNALAQGNANNTMINGISSGIGSIVGSNGFGNLFGGNNNTYGSGSNSNGGINFSNFASPF